MKTGLRNREIAEILHISQDTVKTRMKNVMAKLHAANRTHAVTIASQRGLLDGFVELTKQTDSRAIAAI